MKNNAHENNMPPFFKEDLVRRQTSNICFSQLFEEVQGRNKYNIYYIS